MSESTCEYCGHRNPAPTTKCGDCGAPLSVGAGRAAAAEPGDSAAQPGAARAEGRKRRIGQRLGWQWAAVLGGTVLTVLTGVFVARSCSIELAPPDLLPGHSAAGPEKLPGPLRGAVSCAPLNVETMQKCVIRAANPLLAGGITGGRDLTLYVQTGAADQLAAAIERWRGSGATVVTDGAVFAAIGRSATLHVAHTGNRLQLETGTFSDRKGAQVFLARSGFLG
ncbi:hypothetical protein [Nocardia sp. NPDC051832]|uniref:hypothetical protein n=1 Tax=Nocardia sp. NPDC051832 TaxID=3155673 RepID=UPI00342FA78E